ncbi:MAG: peptidoglycan hydrolase [Sphaerobacteraceae bacterium]|nr:MAG: peptidoglycan hydrolase [Sphaerobacteraceae bacterium]
MVAPNLTQDASAYPNRIRWGYYVQYDATSLTSLRQQVHNLDVVSPYLYQVRSDGTIHTFQSDAAIQVMRDAGVKIVPMVTNNLQWDAFTGIIEDEEMRADIIERLVDLVETNDWDGIHIDFEGINADDAEHITQFQKELSEELWPRDRMVTQAVIARVSDFPSVWGGAYDYAELAKYNDHIVIMAYDHTPVGAARPYAVAPEYWVRNVARYASSRIPNEKVLLGVPFYGYDWLLKDDDSGATDGRGRAMKHSDTMALNTQDNIEYHWDDRAKTPWASYTDSEGREREVWYEDVESLRYKLDVMVEYDLGGMAAWRLGQEDPAVWEQISMMSTPASRVAPVESTDTLWYFTETGHTLRTVFLNYWLQSGGLPVFGFPQTEEFAELNADTMREHTVQYFERQRFEYHPEHAGTPYEVLLGRLGHEEAVRRGLLTHPAFDSEGQVDDADCLYYEATGQNACGVFLDYWQSHGLDFGDTGISYRESLALFGYPISAEFTDPDTGLTIQYFERARFEHHPEHAGTQYEVLLGLLGNDELREKGWIR